MLGVFLTLSVCQLPDNLSLDHPAWADLLRRIELDPPDIAVLNEMPFGPWIANGDTFDPALATASLDEHERALPVLLTISTPVLSSPPLPAPRNPSTKPSLL